MFLSNPLFGVGPKNFRMLCNDEKYFVKHGCSTHPHNTYVQLLSETGIVGFIPIISIFFILSFVFLKQFFCFNRI